MEERLALSYELLNKRGSPIAPHISFSLLAVEKIVSSLSMTHGPAIIKIGLAPPSFVFAMCISLVKSYVPLLFSFVSTST